ADAHEPGRPAGLSIGQEAAVPEHRSGAGGPRLLPIARTIFTTPAGGYGAGGHRPFDRLLERGKPDARSRQHPSKGDNREVGDRRRAIAHSAPTSGRKPRSVACRRSTRPPFCRMERPPAGRHVATGTGPGAAGYRTEPSGTRFHFGGFLIDEPAVRP